MTENKNFKNQISSEHLAHLISKIPSFVDGKFLSREGNLKLLHKQLFPQLAKNGGGVLLINNASREKLVNEKSEHALNFINYYEGKAFKFIGKTAGEYERGVDEFINIAKAQPLTQHLVIVADKADADKVDTLENVFCIRSIGNGAYFACSEKTADLLLADYSEL